MRIFHNFSNSNVFKTYNLGIITPLIDKPDDKILDWSEFKPAEDKINLTEKLKFVLGRVDRENMTGKGENDGHQHLFLFKRRFQKAFFFFSIVR